jgi:hypothetical protein
MLQFEDRKHQRAEQEVLTQKEDSEEKPYLNLQRIITHGLDTEFHRRRVTVK